MRDQIIILGFALIMFVGAFMGLKAGSKISLIMGLISGCVVLLADILVITQPKTGYLVLTIFSGNLIVVFLQRFLKTKKMMPAGFLMALSAAFFAYMLYQYIR